MRDILVDAANEADSTRKTDPQRRTTMPNRRTKTTTKMRMKVKVKERKMTMKKTKTTRSIARMMWMGKM